jgi:hypothetical protein
LSAGLAAALAAGLWLAAVPVQAFEAKVLDSVVSVLPLWPGHAQGGQPQM